MFALIQKKQKNLSYFNFELSCKPQNNELHVKGYQILNLPWLLELV